MLFVECIVGLYIGGKIVFFGGCGGGCVYGCCILVMRRLWFGSFGFLFGICCGFFMYVEK